MNEELRVIISAEVDKLKRGVKDAQKQVKTFATKSKENIKQFNEEFQKFGDVSKKALATVGTAVVGAAAALLTLSASTAEYRTAQAKLNTAFQTAGSTAAQAKTTYNDLYRVLGDGDVAVEAANHLAKLTTNQEHLSEWTNICQGVYATFGDSLPIEGLTEAANETAKTGALTGGLADALNWAGVAEEEFQQKLDACNTEAEREALIRGTLNGLYKDAAASYEENASSLLKQNEAQAKLDASLAAMGEAIAPINTALTELAAQILAELTPYIQEFAEKYLPSIQEALGGVGIKIGEFITWIADNWDLLVNLGTVILTIATACSVFSAAMGIVNGVMYASPITWIIAAIIALIAVIALCIIYWDDISAAVKNAWDTMIKWVTEKADAIGKKVSEMVESVKKWFGQMKENMINAVKGAKEDTVKTFDNMKAAYQEKGGGIKGVVAAMMEGIKGKFSIGYNFINNLTGGKLGEIKDKITNKLTEAKNKVSEILNNIKNSFTEKFNAVKDTVKGVIDAITGFFTNIKWSLPKIPMPHFTVTGKLDLLVWPPQVPSLSVEWYAKGGVFDKPTLFGYGNGSIGGLGEAGAEAVVPLEKNTKWLDIIANKLAAKQGSTPIVLEVDGKVFAQTSIDSINQLTRQSGKLGLNII